MDSIAILFELHYLPVVLLVLLQDYQIQTITNHLLSYFCLTDLTACFCFACFADLVKFVVTAFEECVALEHHRFLHFAQQFLDKTVSIVGSKL